MYKLLEGNPKCLKTKSAKWLLKLGKNCTLYTCIEMLRWVSGRRKFNSMLVYMYMCVGCYVMLFGSGGSGDIEISIHW